MGFLTTTRKQSDKFGQNGLIGKVCLLLTDQEWVPQFPRLISLMVCDMDGCVGILVRYWYFEILVLDNYMGILIRY